MYIGMLFSSVHLLHHVLCLFVRLPSNCAHFYFQPLFFNTCQKVINGFVWLGDHHGPSPILCDTVTLFVSIVQLFCHCVFIHAYVHWKSVSFLYDSSLRCFCLLAESHKTINQSCQSINLAECCNLLKPSFPVTTEVLCDYSCDSNKTISWKLQAVSMGIGREGGHWPPTPWKKIILKPMAVG